MHYESGNYLISRDISVIIRVESVIVNERHQTLLDSSLRKFDLIPTGRLPHGVALQFGRQVGEERFQPVGLFVGHVQLLELDDEIAQLFLAPLQEETYADRDEEAVADGLVLLDPVGQAFQMRQHREQ